MTFTTLTFNEDPRRSPSEALKHCSFVCDRIDEIELRANLCRALFRSSAHQIEFDVGCLEPSLGCENVYDIPNSAAIASTLDRCACPG